MTWIRQHAEKFDERYSFFVRRIPLLFLYGIILYIYCVWQWTSTTARMYFWKIPRVIYIWLICYFTQFHLDKLVHQIQLSTIESLAAYIFILELSLIIYQIYDHKNDWYWTKSKKFDDKKFCIDGINAFYT